MLLAPPAMAQVETREGIYLQNQILELKQQFQQMQQIQSSPGMAPAVPEGEGAPAPAPGVSAGGNDSVAQLLVRVTELEEELRSMRGKLAELSNQAQRDHDELNKKIDDLAFKTGHGAVPAPGDGAAPDAAAAGGAAGAAAGGAAGVRGIGADPQAPGGYGAPGSYGGGAAPPIGADTAPDAPPPVAKPPPRRSADAAFKAGSAALARRDYVAASAAANEVLAAPPNKDTADARYLLGRAELGQHKFKEAMAAFVPIYKAGPKTLRGGEALLGITNSLIGLNKLDVACKSALKLAADFPKNAVLRDGSAQARKRAHCA